MVGASCLQSHLYLLRTPSLPQETLQGDQAPHPAHTEPVWSPGEQQIHSFSGYGGGNRLKLKIAIFSLY